MASTDHGHEVNFETSNEDINENGDPNELLHPEFTVT